MAYLHVVTYDKITWLRLGFKELDWNLWDIPTVTWEEYNTFNESHKQQISQASTSSTL